MTGLSRPQAQHLLGEFLFSGYAEQEKPVACSRAGSAVGSARRRLRLGALPRPRRADEPPRPRGPRGARGGTRGLPGALLLVSHDRALLDAVAERTVAIEERTLRSYDGGWADLIQKRVEETATPPPRPPEMGRPRPRQGRSVRPRRRRGARPSEQVEHRITTLEQHVAQLEAKLADDWTNMDTLTEYRTSRDELQELLARWEVLFESA